MEIFNLKKKNKKNSLCSVKKTDVSLITRNYYNHERKFSITVYKSRNIPKNIYFILRITRKQVVFFLILIYKNKFLIGQRILYLRKKFIRTEIFILKK